MNNHLRKNAKFFRKALLLISCFLAINFTFAQTGNPIAGYTYLGGCDGHHYYLSDAALTWPAAKTAANNLGGYLATLTSQEENDCVFGHLETYLLANGGLVPPLEGTPQWFDDRHPWIGLTDQAQEGTWIWENGENCSDYRNWDFEEPNNFEDAEDYAQLLVFQPNGNKNKQPGKWNDWFNNESQTYIVEFGPNRCNEGCSPGFWKNHTNQWTSPYTPGTTVGSQFSAASAFPSLASQTLSQAIQGGGGPGTLGGASILLRAAVAALLNAADPDVDYPRTTEQVIAAVNAALASNRQTMLNLAEELDRDNNLGCPLSGRASSATSTIPGIMEQHNVLAGELQANVLQNPSYTAFSIKLARGTNEKITLRIMDLQGRLVEQRQNLQSDQILRIGETYRPGMYIVDVIQGSTKKQLKLVKSGN